MITYFELFYKKKCFPDSFGLPVPTADPPLRHAARPAPWATAPAEVFTCLHFSPLANTMLWSHLPQYGTFHPPSHLPAVALPLRALLVIQPVAKVPQLGRFISLLAY